MSKLRIPLRVVFYEEDELWVAHCLEFDLVGTGGDKKTALSMLSEAIGIQFIASTKSRNMKNLFRPADSEFFQKFAEGKDTANGTFEVAIEGQEKKKKDVDFGGTQVRIWRPKASPRSRSQRAFA